MQQDRNFIIKINDFLKSTTISDILLFKDKFTPELPHITGGISCKVQVQRGDDETVFVRLMNITYTGEYICDRCGERKEKTSLLDDIMLSCYANYPEQDLKEYEVSFLSKDGRVDLEKTFIQEISLNEPIKNLCDNCQNVSTPIGSEIKLGNSIVRKN